MRTSRRLALSLAALGLALSGSACTYLNPVQTHEFYQAGDGTNGNIVNGDSFVAGARNMMLLIDEEGQAAVIGSVVNYGTEETTVTLEALADGQTVFSTRVPVPAKSVVTLGSEPDQHFVAVGNVQAKPGQIIDLVISEGDQAVEISMPVMSAENFTN